MKFIQSFLSFVAFVVIVALASKGCEQDKNAYYIDYPDQPDCNARMGGPC